MESVGKKPRNTYIGGSDAAAVMGLSPWPDSTPLTTYMKKVGIIERGDVDPKKAKIFRRGTLMEPVVRRMARYEWGLKITKASTQHRPNRYVDSSLDFLAAEIDFEWEVTAQLAEDLGLDADLIGTIQNGEIKTSHPFAAAKFGEAETDDVPIEYVAQALHGMMVTGKKVCLFAVLIGSDNLLRYVVKRDEEVIENMRMRMMAFWNNNVLAKKPPAPINLPDVLKSMRKNVGTAIEATAEIEQLARQVKQWKGNVAQLEDAIAENNYQIGKFMLGADVVEFDPVKKRPKVGTKAYENAKAKPGVHWLIYGGEKIMTVRYQERNDISAELVRQLHPEVLADCTKVSRFFKFDLPRGK